MIKTTKKGLSAIVQMLPGLIDEAAAEYNAQPLQAIPEFTISLKSKVAPSKLMQVTSSADIEKAARAVFNADSIDWVESMLIFALSRANKIQGFYKVSQGGINGTVCDPRVIMQFALLANASNIILCHNHPSGNVQPSQGDKEVTQKIKEAARYLDVRVLDHVILTSESYFSFADEGLI